MLYPVPSVRRAAQADPYLLDELFHLLKRAEHEHLLYEGRTYGGGLNKIEPKELTRVPLPDDPLLDRINLRLRQLVLLEQDKPSKTNESPKRSNLRKPEEQVRYARSGHHRKEARRPRTRPRGD
jgi:hypothetical protein